MTTEQRRALANTTPTTEVIRDAVMFPRDRLGEPLDISGPRFDAWLAQVRRDAARAALHDLALHAQEDYQIAAQANDQQRMLADVAVMDAALAWKDHYPEDVTP